MSAATARARTRLPLSLLLLACLALAVLAGAAGAPSFVRAPLTVVGVLLAPGWVWSALLRPTEEPVALAALSVVLSIAETVVVGVLVNALGIPVTGIAVGCGLLVVSAPPLVLGRREGTVAWRWRPSFAGLAVVVGGAVFITALGLTASRMHIVDQGPYARINYTGKLAQLSGPVVASASSPLSVPLRLTTSTGEPWAGEIVVRDGPTTLVRRPVRVPSGAETTVSIPPQRTPGLRPLTITATPDAATATAGFSTPLSLTLRLRVPTA